MKHINRKSINFLVAAASMLAPLSVANRPAIAQSQHLSSRFLATEAVGSNGFLDDSEDLKKWLGLLPSKSNSTTSQGFENLTSIYPFLPSTQGTVGLVMRNPNLLYPDKAPNFRGSIQLLGLFHGKFIFSLTDHEAPLDDVRITNISPLAPQLGSSYFEGKIKFRNPQLDIALAEVDVDPDLLPKSARDALTPIPAQSFTDWMEGVNASLAVLDELKVEQSKLLSDTKKLKESDIKNGMTLAQSEDNLPNVQQLKKYFEGDMKFITILNNIDLFRQHAKIQLSNGQIDLALASQQDLINDLQGITEKIFSVVAVGLPGSTSDYLLHAAEGTLSNQYYKSVSVSTMVASPNSERGFMTRQSRVVDCKYQIDNMIVLPSMSGGTVYWQKQPIAMVNASSHSGRETMVFVTPEDAVRDFFIAKYPIEAKIAGITVSPNLPSECRTAKTPQVSPAP